MPTLKKSPRDIQYMYDIRPNTIIGFHGCDLSTRNKLINNPDEIVISKERHGYRTHAQTYQITISSGNDR